MELSFIVAIYVIIIIKIDNIVKYLFCLDNLVRNSYYYISTILTPKNICKKLQILFDLQEIANYIICIFRAKH
jgi:hypothetical protein